MRRNWGTLPQKRASRTITPLPRKDLGCSPSTLGTSLYGFEESTALPVPARVIQPLLMRMLRV